MDEILRSFLVERLLQQQEDQEEVEDNNNNNNITTTTDSETIYEDDPLDIAKDILVIALGCIAGAVGVVLFTYILSVLADRFAGRRYEEQAMDRSVLARRANLWGLQLSERERILDVVFAKTTFRWEGPTVQAAGMEVGDVERGEQTARQKRTPRKVSLKRLNSSASSRSGRNKKQKKNDKAVETVDDPCEVHGVADDSCALDNDDNEQPPGEDSNTIVSVVDIVDDADHERLCCICLTPYDVGDECMTGTSCEHRFHASCCRAWLLQHDHCPYCRKEMVTPTELRTAACHVLGELRVGQLSLASMVLPSTVTAAAPAPASAQATSGNQEESLPASPDDPVCGKSFVSTEEEQVQQQNTTSQDNEADGEGLNEQTGDFEEIELAVLPQSVETTSATNENDADSVMSA